MSGSNAQAVAAPLTKSIVFVIVTVLVLGLIGFELSGGGWFSATKTYSAVFRDTSGLRSGDSVRIAGVKVGKVSDVSVYDNTQGLVTFDVDADRELPEGVLASARYLNLTGDRYLALAEGPGSTAPLAEGATLPITQTKPALDLDVLLAGFNPLFEGLAPEKINSLTQDVIQVFQGEGGTIESLLARAASLTNTLADRDQVIGQVVTNLNTVLGTLDQRAPQLEQTIDNLQELISGLNADRGPLGQSFADVNRLVGSTDTLLADLRGPLRGTVDQLDRVATLVNEGQAAVDENLSLLPGAYLRVSRLGSRGATYNLFICSLRLKLTGPDGQPMYTPWVGPSDNVDRCKPGVDPLETPEQRAAYDPVVEERRANPPGTGVGENPTPTEEGGR
ncbi:MCE family protein [Pseudonocardia sp. WMMC193]|uniref:MCE family protein n=1 Tax=Pseudonocardia sp. WMMC193 TaxID=2911965 RepID=UPI001F17D562|nr:MCE family protein [Pseudonocardia sp. WMMC193]MCF7549543.1 MCE family protein [Pseudonocardia sp. WMMC193]